VKKDESLTRKSAEELVRKATALQTAFGGEEKTYVLNLTKAELNGLGTAVPGLKDLLDKAILAVQG
jgi:CRISPR system Cascade subunit CasC